MFDSIAFRYDFLNHFLSFGIDRYWRRKAVGTIGQARSKSYILDVATGTCDLALAAARLNPVKITGIDLSLKMLESGREKIARKGLSGVIELLQGDSENLPFEDNSFDVAMVAFGVRNFADPLKGLTEICRVIRNEGLVVILEFSKPDRFPFRQLFNFYFLNILPLIGRLFSGSRNAYTYLPESVLQFPDNEEFKTLMERAGLSGVRQERLTGGVVSIYSGIRKLTQ